MEAFEKELTISTYDESAADLAEFFAGIGSRKEDVERAFSFISKHHPTVVEIGCGDGRDAVEILELDCDYVGFDISAGMIAQARQKIPGAIFEVADLNEYKFPHDTDIIFAFASLLHSDKQEVAALLKRAHRALSRHGIIYISLKMDQYHKFITEDQFGIRYFYAYMPEDIKELAGDKYLTIYEDTQQKGNTNWFTLVLRKI